MPGPFIKPDLFHLSLNLAAILDLVHENKRLRAWGVIEGERESPVGMLDDLQKPHPIWAWLALNGCGWVDARKVMYPAVPIKELTLLVNTAIIGSCDYISKHGFDWSA